MKYRDEIIVTLFLFFSFLALTAVPVSVILGAAYLTNSERCWRGPDCEGKHAQGCCTWVKPEPPPWTCNTCGDTHGNN